MIKQIDHPILGLIDNDNGLWKMHREFSVSFSSCTIKEILIDVDDPEDQPSARQLKALIDLLQAPDSFRKDLETSFFINYRDEIRPDILMMYGDDPLAYGVAPEDVPNIIPEISDPTEMWQLVKGCISIFVRPDGSISIAYENTFDEEHNVVFEVRDLHIEDILVE